MFCAVPEAGCDVIVRRYSGMSNCTQAEQLAKHLQLEQQKAEQDRAKWERQEADMQHSLQETMSTSQRLQDAKDSVEQEHSNLQELHRQLMAELQQRNGQTPEVWLI